MANLKNRSLLELYRIPQSVRSNTSRSRVGKNWQRRHILTLLPRLQPSPPCEQKRCSQPRGLKPPKLLDTFPIGGVCGWRQAVEDGCPPKEPLWGCQTPGHYNARIRDAVRSCVIASRDSTYIHADIGHYTGFVSITYTRLGLPGWMLFFSKHALMRRRSSRRTRSWVPGRVFTSIR